MKCWIKPKWKNYLIYREKQRQMWYFKMDNYLQGHSQLPASKRHYFILKIWKQYLTNLYFNGTIIFVCVCIYRCVVCGACACVNNDVGKYIHASDSADMSRQIYIYLWPTMLMAMTQLILYRCITHATNEPWVILPSKKYCLINHCRSINPGGQKQYQRH